MPSKQQLKLLLIQIRDDEQTRQEELSSFAQFCEVAESQFDIWNVFDQPHYDHQRLADYHAVLVGGSSEASVLEPERYPFVEDIQALLRECLQRKLPVFASCFGFQLAVLALGGEIFHHDQDFEMGTLPIRLTEAAQTDPLFSTMPDPFVAVSVHRDSAYQLPAGCINLAETNHCVHALKVEGAPFWATQFHPEVDRAILVQRLSLFADKYTEGADQLRAVLDGAVETPESNALLGQFVERILLDEQST